MEALIVAFEGEKSCRHVREILEHGGVAFCIVCHSAAEVKRTVSQQRGAAVLCGYKLPDQSAEELFQDLPPDCPMMILAQQSLLDLCGEGEIQKLAAPARRAELLAAVAALLERSRRGERDLRPRRSGEEEALICRAKEMLMARRGMTEEQAHRYLQKRSMDRGMRLAESARLILEQEE